MNFESLAQSDQCQRASATSHVIVADVRSSTKLTQLGRQRDVNLVGAACIAAVRNLFPIGQVPYVFGGDGATFLVENADLKTCLDALVSVQTAARRNLNISLRVGSVTVNEIRERGADVLFGSIKSGDEELMTFLRGDGVALADSIVKQREKDSPENLNSADDVNAPLEGLACRLLPFKNRRGVVNSYIIDPLVSGSEQDQIFMELFTVLKGNHSVDRFCPIHSDGAQHRWLSPQVRSEAALVRPNNKLSTRIKFLFDKIVASIITKYVFAFDKENGVTGKPSRYIEELPEQSDWIKANGSLYLILDMNKDEEQYFNNWLSAREKEGKLRFGVHSSDSALVTCHLHSSNQKRHFHFVDNSDGGLTVAATMLKAKKSSTGS
ncbi:MAG: hypothetical protein RLZZ488_795 [Pseudomonadota bacterium]|jgi:hypothetical protein